MKNNLILIADDNEENLKVLSKILRNQDYQIAVANNGPKALEISKKREIDLILLDIMMPRLNGFEVCKKLKAKPETKEIPVIFISALKETEKKVKGFKVGGADYITKPFKSEEVMARVKVQLELNQTRKELKKQIKLEKLSTKLSKRFIDLQANDIAATIEEGLEMVAEFIDVDYSYIHLFSENNQKIKNKFHWYKNEFAIEKLEENTSDVNLENLPWLLKQLETREIIDISNVNNLPQAAKNFKSILVDEGVRSSLILPLEYNDNLVGILGFDSIAEIKHWDKKEIILFKVIADIFTNVFKRKENEEKINEYYLEVEMQNMELEKLYKDLENEFEKARRLHQQFLPKELPEIQGLSYDTFFQPSDKLGGDFYNAIKLKNQLLIYLADVSGHGLDGSMMNIFLRETINNYLLYKHQENSTLKPSDLISYVAKKYRNESFPAEYFICLLIGVVDIEEMEISFANAGFQFPPIKVSKTGEVSALSCGGMPISSVIAESLFKEIYNSDFQEEKVTLAKGDTIFVTTDGLLEEVVEEKVYGEERLKRVLAKNYKYPANLITTKIKKDFKKFAGSLSAQDDLTFLTLKRDLDIIDKFKRKIKSKLSQMYKVQEKIVEFIAPYYQMPSVICVGFQEIVINAMEHGNKMDPEKEVMIEIEVTKEWIKTIITDEGEGFDWSLIAEKELNIENDSIDESERGRGIKISNKLYDELWYNEKGNQACLLKLR